VRPDPPQGLDHS
jgi:hypothetical protein